MKPVFMTRKILVNRIDFLMRVMVLCLLVFFMPSRAEGAPQDSSQNITKIAQAPSLDALPSDDITRNALTEWDKLYSVFSHPRCASCHVGDDNRPRWMGTDYGLDPGEAQFHGMNVNGGMSRIGAETLPCMTCHQEENSDILNGPPGAHVWALAPVEMEWFDKSSAYICAQIKDPARNGGRSLEAVSDHINNDDLVHWGWSPGPGRTPAPFGRKETVDIFNAWIAQGAPCPDGS